MNKGNDINVGSIEEDIEILNSLLTFKGKGLEYALEKKSIKAIENILQDYTRQKQINEEHQKTNGELREKVKELEEQVEYDKTHIYTPLTIQLNFIPKQKIEDKIEELKEENYQISLESKVVFDTGIMKNNLKIQVLQELLQESEDK